MIALMVIGFGIVLFIQIPSLVRKRWWKDLIGFAILLLMGFILSVMLSLGIKIPPITTIISNFITELFGM